MVNSDVSEGAVVNNEEPERSAKTNVPSRGRAMAKNAKQAGGGKRWWILVTFLISNRFSVYFIYSIFIIIYRTILHPIIPSVCDERDSIKYAEMGRAKRQNLRRSDHNGS